MSTSTILPVIHPVEGELHTDSLAHLHTALADATDGIEKLRTEADASTAPVFEAFAEMHRRHDRELTAEMVGKGHAPGDEGTFHHLVQSSRETLRHLFESPGEDALHHLLDNERKVLEAYNHALEQGGPSETVGLLQRQREELGNLVIKHDSRLS